MKREDVEALAAELRRKDPGLSDDQALDAAVLQLYRVRIQPFAHHDDQSEWGALTMELIDQEGVNPNVACYQARADLADLLAYARDWDNLVAELVPFTPSAA